MGFLYILYNHYDKLGMSEHGGLTPNFQTNCPKMGSLATPLELPMDHQTRPF